MVAEVVLAFFWPFSVFRVTTLSKMVLTLPAAALGPGEFWAKYNVVNFWVSFERSPATEMTLIRFKPGESVMSF